jgi:hypothetical protein
MSEMVQQGSTVELQFLSGNQYVIKRATERTENLNIQFSFKGNEKDIAWDRHKNVYVCGGVVLPVNGSQPSTLDNCISNGNTCTSKQ